MCESLSLFIYLFSLSLFSFSIPLSFSLTLSLFLFFSLSLSPHFFYTYSNTFTNTTSLRGPLCMLFKWPRKIWPASNVQNIITLSLSIHILTYVHEHDNLAWPSMYIRVLLLVFIKTYCYIEDIKYLLNIILKMLYGYKVIIKIHLLKLVMP